MTTKSNKTDAESADEYAKMMDRGHRAEKLMRELKPILQDMRNNLFEEFAQQDTDDDVGSRLAKTYLHVIDDFAAHLYARMNGSDVARIELAKLAEKLKLH